MRSGYARVAKDAVASMFPEARMGKAGLNPSESIRRMVEWSTSRFNDRP